MKTIVRTARRQSAPMGRLAWFITLVSAMAVGAVACGDGGESTNGTGGQETPTTPDTRELNPIPASSEFVVGPMHFGLGLLDASNEPILGEPGTSLKLRLFFGDELKQEAEARFMWAIPSVNGFWRADVNFDQAGQWKVEVLMTRDSEDLSVNISLPVLEKGFVPMVGDAAPPTINLTLADAPDYQGLSTDRDPEPGMYQMTVAEAVEAGKPFVLVIATPAFCETQFCGPVVDNVQAVFPEFSDRANFIHIEPFQLDGDNRLVTDERGAPVPAQPMIDWQLQTEPWVFVVDAQGNIADRYEGTVSSEELRDSLQAVLGG